MDEKEEIRKELEQELEWIQYRQKMLKQAGPIQSPARVTVTRRRMAKASEANLFAIG